MTFALLVMFDIAENLYYTIKMISIWIKRAQHNSRQNKRMASRKMEEVSPEIAYLCGNVFFSELVEILAPL